MQDTSAAQARRGKDIQGIPWKRLSITREKYRQTRLEQYKNYENIPQSGEGSEKVSSSLLLLLLSSTLFQHHCGLFKFLFSFLRRNAKALLKEVHFLSLDGIQDLLSQQFCISR